MEIKKIIRSTYYLVFSRSIGFILGLIRAKLAAIYIGTIGVGIFNQVLYMATTISTFTLVSMNDGLVNQIASNKEKKDFVNTFKGFLKAYALLVLIACSFSILICIFFSDELTKFFLGDYNLKKYFLFGVSCIPILIINSISYAILKSHKSTKYISKTTILSSILSLLIYVPLIYYMGTIGAVISILSGYLLSLYFNNYYARIYILSGYNISLKDILMTRIDFSKIKYLIYFAFFGLTTGIYQLIVESFGRSIVINELGINKIGIYSPIISWSNLFTGFILPSLDIYLYPRYSECKSNSEINGIFNDYLRLISFGMIPFLFLAIPFRNQIICFFYSSDFLEASLYLPWHFIGILFHMWMYIMEVLFIPTQNLKLFSLFKILFFSLCLAIVYLLIPIYGLYGWMLRFLIPPILFSVIYFMFFVKKINLQIFIPNILLISYILFLSILLIIIDNYAIKYLASFVFIIGSYFLLTKQEAEFVLIKVKSVFKYLN